MKRVRNFLIAILSGFVSYYALMFLGCALFSMSYSNLVSEMQHAAQSIQNAPLIRYMLAVQTVSIFLVPAFVLLRLFHIPISEVPQRPLPPVFVLIALIVLVLCNMPGINFLSYCNTQCVHMFIDDNSILTQSYEHNERITEFLLNTTSIKYLIFNILIIALLPAIGEELFFRGLLQQALQRSMHNVHAAIFISAFIFSIMHNDVFNLVPRLAMGMLFGYVLYTTKKMQYAIVAHCVHNATVVLVYFFIHKQYLPPQFNTIGEIGNGSIAGVASLLLVALTMIAWWRNSNSRV
ncbi:MAG: CPBP family intramembrane metalloprotease [Bacteroidales bacterium]|jgi:membrane protease YdiL (CAAX protease family)|nr:CPBP family intramembrane metalloprotease [Bacteroidales bacterium]